MVLFHHRRFHRIPGAYSVSYLNVLKNQAAFGGDNELLISLLVLVAKGNDEKLDFPSGSPKPEAEPPKSPSLCGGSGLDLGAPKILEW